ncbi:MAG: glycosyltransferase [Clostridia bacterium]
MDQKVSVIIPAFNEELNIANIIRLSKNCKYVDEVLVINNLSTDNTKLRAKEQGARVVDCNIQGKGYAMQTGIENAQNDIIVFLDADIPDYPNDVILRLVSPIIEKDVDFVKASFDREGGRITELVAKPLLKLLFPDMQKYSQPLSGMIAGKKEIFEKLELEKDYGVDIGILLDISKNKAIIQEAYLGKIKNISKDWKSLDKMATDVMKAMLKRANKL